MKIEESFTRAFIEVQKTFPVLAQDTERRVVVSVSSIISIAKAFHAKGWNDSDLLGSLSDLFKRG